MLHHVLHYLAELDNFAIEATQTLRWEPLTVLFVVASAWWVKWPLIAALGAVSDSRPTPARAMCALSASIAAGVAALSVALLKEVTDRARPPVAERRCSRSSPSRTRPRSRPGMRRLRSRRRRPWPSSTPPQSAACSLLAALVALSRVYLGVHYWSDVLVGSLFGIAVGWATVLGVQLGVRALRGRAQSREERGTSSVSSP